MFLVHFYWNMFILNSHNFWYIWLTLLLFPRALQSRKEVVGTSSARQLLEKPNFAIWRWVAIFPIGYPGLLLRKGASYLKTWFTNVVMLSAVPFVLLILLTPHGPRPLWFSCNISIFCDMSWTGGIFSITISFIYFIFW